MGFGRSAPYPLSRGSGGNLGARRRGHPGDRSGGRTCKGGSKTQSRPGFEAPGMRPCLARRVVWLGERPRILAAWKVVSGVDIASS